jgi:hypothetical protein
MFCSFICFFVRRWFVRRNNWLFAWKKWQWHILYQYNIENV